MRVLLTGVRAPSAAHAARLLADGGCTVLAADALANPLTRRSAFVDTHLRHPSPREDYPGFRDWVGATVRDHAVDLVFPTCEEVLHLARAAGELGIPGRVFAPDLTTLLSHHDKFAFITTMRAAGFAVPDTRLLASSADRDAVAGDLGDLVLKPALSRFACRAYVRPDTSVLSQVLPTSQDPWVAQEALTGDEVCLYLIARDGRLTALSAYAARHRAGKGAGIHFVPVMSDRIRAFAERFAATGWSGQASFDCIDTPDRGLMPIECNPRATSGVHFFTDGPAFVAAVRGEGTATPDSGALQVVPAMFLYGLPAALRAGKVRAWWRDLTTAGNAMSYARPGLRATTACMREIASGARRRGQTLAESTTHDIEWNLPFGARLPA